MSETPRSVLVAEKDPHAGRQIQACLALAGMTVFPVVHSLDEALASLDRTIPDVIVADIAVAGGARGEPRLPAVAARTGTPLVLLSARTDSATLTIAADAHAAGLVVKPFTDRQLVATVSLAAMRARRDGADPELARRLNVEEKLRAIAAVVNDHPFDVLPLSAPSDAATATLSAREREIVDMLANGARVVTIAQHLELSPHTVRNHLKSVFRKLNVRGQHELFEYWRRRNAG